MVLHERMGMMLAVDHNGGMMAFHLVIHHRVFVGGSRVALRGLHRGCGEKAECGDGQDGLSCLHHSAFHGVSSKARGSIRSGPIGPKFRLNGAMGLPRERNV